MNLKQLIQFGLEESQEPVIKNPVLRQALEPRSMDQASLVDDLEPGSLKDEMKGNFDPSQETYEEYLRRINLERPFNMNQGGRIGFKNGLSVDLYNTLYDEYAELIEQGIKNEKLMDIPSWDKYIKSKNLSPMALKYYEGGEGIRINPSTLLQNKKIELAEKIIERENAKLNGAFKRGKNPPKGKPHVAELFRNKVVGSTWNLGGKHPGMNTLLNNLINTKLDTRAKKIEKAFKLVTSPEYELSDGIRNEIAKLMGESKDMFDAGKLKSPYGPNPNEVWEELIKPYEYVDEKTGKTKNLLKKINQKINKLPKGTDTTFSYLLELAENDRLGKAGFSDWEKFAGYKPEQWAMRQVDRAWKNNDPRLKIYNLDGTPITWEPGKKISSDKVLFEYVDEKFPQYKNKLYSYFKPNENALKNLKTKIPNKNFFDLSTQIKTLPEWEELVKVVDGRNRLKTTEMINPFTGEKSTYQKVYEDIYSRVGTTQTKTKGGYSKIAAMGAHIDHDFGQAKGLFNNLRISTGQQNQLFKTLMDASEKIPELKPYIRAIESEMYAGGSIDDQIKAIVNEANELGKVVKNAPGKITLPTATQTAAYKFLQNKIPGVSQKVIDYLTPFAQKAEGTLKGQPELEKMLLDNSWCLSPFKKASGGRIGFANGSGCPDSVKRKNFIALNNDVRTGKITGEAAEQIAKKTSDVISKAGSKSVISKLLGPYGIGLDVVYEVGAVGTDIYGGKPWKEAVQDNWIAGKFMPGTSLEEFHRNFYKKHPGAKPYGQGLELEQVYIKKQKEIDRLKANTTARGRAEAEKRIPELERDLRGIAASYNALGNAMQPGSPEYENYMAAKTEYLDARKATSPATKAKLEMELNRPTSDRAVPYQKVEPVKIDFSLPKPVEISETPLDANQLQAYAEYHRDVGDLEPRGELPQSYIDEIQQQEKWRQLFEQPGIRGTQDWRGAGGGIAGIRRPNAIPPESGPTPQGLPSMLNRVRRI